MERVGATMTKRKVPRMTANWRARGGGEGLGRRGEAATGSVRRREKVGSALGRFAASSKRVIERGEDEKSCELEAGRKWVKAVSCACRCDRRSWQKG